MGINVKSPKLLKILALPALLFFSQGCSLTSTEEGKRLNSYSCFKTNDPELAECTMFNDRVRGDFLFYMNNKRVAPFGDPSRR